MRDSHLPTIDQTLLSRFEADWHAEGPVALEEYLPPEKTPDYLPTLEELVHVDLELRWKRLAQDESKDRSDGPRVEEYLDRFPALSQNDVLRRLTAQEYRVRNKYGDPPAAAEFRERFPTISITDEDFETLNWQTEKTTGATWKPYREDPNRYQFLEVCGSGGFGDVWKVQDHELGRQVAIKQLNDKMSGYISVRERFVQEAKITARLDHPGVVPIYDLGIDGTSPQYSMKLVLGDTLADAIRDFHRISDKLKNAALEELKLNNAFLSVVSTMEFAHSRKVIHRDLKPQNIILGEYGETFILDWGLAKQMDTSVDEAPAIHHPEPARGLHSKDTRAGTVQGTIPYMAPEQAAGRNDQVDQLSDVYSLGVILFQILTGRVPFKEPDQDKLLQQVIHDEAPTPRSLNPRIPGALEGICLKAISKSRSARYQNAQQLRTDLERYLANEPISCYRPSILEWINSWCRRHVKTAMALVTGLILVAISSPFIAFIQYSWRIAAEQVVIQDRRLERDSLTFTLGTIEGIWRSEPGMAAEMLEGKDCPPDERDFAWGLYRRVCEWELWKHETEDSQTKALALASDDRWLAVGGEDGSIRLLDPQTGELINVADANGHWIISLAFLPEADQLVTGDETGALRFWTVPDLEPIGESIPAHSGHVNAMLFVPASEPSGSGSTLGEATLGEAATQPGYLATAGAEDGLLKLWNIDTRSAWKEFAAEAEVLSLGYRTGHNQIMMGLHRDPLEAGLVQLWNPANVHSDHSDLIQVGAGPTHTVAYDPTSRFLAASGIGWIYVFDELSKPVWKQTEAHVDHIYALCFTPSGNKLASGGMDGNIRMWQAASGRLQTTLVIDQPVLSLAHTRDGRHIISSGMDGTLQAWDGQPAFASQVRDIYPETRQSILGLVFRPGSADLFLAGGDPLTLMSDGDVQLLDAAGGPPTHSWHAHENTINAVAASPRGDRLATASADKTVKLWDAETFKLLKTFTYAVYANAVAFSPTGSSLAIGTADGKIHVIRNLNGAASTFVLGQDGTVPAIMDSSPIRQLAFHANETRLISASYDRHIVHWNLERRIPISEKVFPGTQLPFFAQSPLDPNDTGHQMVSETSTGGGLSALVTWSLDSHEAGRRFGGQTSPYTAARYSPDAKTLATGDETGRIQLWDPHEGKLRATLTGHEATITAVIFSENGQELVSADVDGMVIHWLAAKIQPDKDNP